MARRPISDGVKKMYMIAGVGCVAAFGGKQLLWQHVSTQVTEVRDREHKKALEVYDTAIRNAQEFKLPPLSEEQRERVRSRMKADGVKSASEIEKGGEVVGTIPPDFYPSVAGSTTQTPDSNISTKECCAEKK